MLRKFITIGIILISLNANSQSKNNKEIIAEGGAKMKVRPDLVTFTLTVGKRDTIEKNVIKALNTEIDELVKSLFKIGFTNTVIKISDYSITSSQNDDEKKRYTASNILKLEFGLDTKIIDALYKEIQKAELKDLDVSFETKVSENLEKATRIKLVQLAIEDAKSNANNIANTLDIKLIQVKQVLKYKEGLLPTPPEISQVKFTPPKVVSDSEISYDTSFEKFQVEDVELEEKITIVYEIGK